MSDLDFDRIFSVLERAPRDKPWVTAGGIARRLGDATLGPAVERMLLEHCRHSEDGGEPPKVRYSSLPSRRTLEVLWGDLDKVGSRALESITKDDVADGALSEFENLDQASVFFSHSFRDYADVLRIARGLLEKGVVPWLAETHIAQGEHIHDEVIGALGASQALLLFLSPHALDSRWTGKEYSNARARGIPIVVVANIDFAPIREILRLHRRAEMPDANRVAGFGPGAQDFVRELLDDEAHIVKVFVYSREPIAEATLADLRPAGTLADLPGAIKAAIRAPGP